MSLRQIYEGWKNHVAPAEYMKEIIFHVSNERLAICRACPYDSINAKKTGYKSVRIDEHCTDCGCSLLPKTKCLSCYCPQDKWGAETTGEQQKEMENEEEI